MATLDLGYLVEIADGYKFEYLVSNFKKVFQAYLHEKRVAPDPEGVQILTTYLSPNSYQLSVTVQLGERQLRSAHLLAMAIGHPFRTRGIVSATLTRIEIAGDHPGPNWGFGYLDDSNTDWTSPEIMLSIPPIDSFDEFSELVSVCVEEGVRTFCDDAPVVSTVEESISTIELISRESRKNDQPLRYFLNGLRPQIERNTIEEGARMAGVDHALGWRMCPVSSGLTSITDVRESGYPIMAYPLISLSTSSRSMTPGALARLLRWEGVDILVVGINALEMLHSETANDVLRALAVGDQQHSPGVVPVFSGSITPHVAHELVSTYGPAIGLHMQSPILRAGRDHRKVRRNTRAITEAVSAALAGRTIDQVMKKERKASLNWRSYEAEYGLDHSIDRGLPHAWY